MREDKIIQIITKTEIVDDIPIQSVLGLSDAGVVYELCSETPEENVEANIWVKLITSPCRE